MRASSLLLIALAAGSAAFACTSRDVAPDTSADTSAITDDPTITARTTCKDGTCWTCRDVPIANGYRTHCDAPCSGGSSGGSSGSSGSSSGMGGGGGGTYTCDDGAPASQCPPPGAGSTSDQGGGDNGGHTCDGGTSGGDQGGGDQGGGGNGGSGGSSSSSSSSGGGSTGGGGYTCSTGDTTTECSGPPKCNPGTYPSNGTCQTCTGQTCDQPACAGVGCCGGMGGGGSSGGGNGGSGSSGGGHGNGNGGGHGGSSGGSSSGSSGGYGSGSGGGTSGGSSGGSSSGSSGGSGGAEQDGGGYVYSSGCTLTQGFWKNHPSAWPVTSLTIGNATYTESEAIALLQTPPKGDASLILGHQLIASMLNAAAGAGTPPSVATALSDAQAWMTANVDADGRLPYGVASSTAVGAEATTLSGELDTYNNGGAGVPHCN